MSEDKDLDFERKHQEDLQRLRGFRLLDDDFMTKVFEDEDCAGVLLKIILHRDDLTVKHSNSQYTIKNLQGRSMRLDILAVDRENHVYNIEIQRNDKGAGIKRARYNSGLLDANVTEPGKDLLPRSSIFQNSLLKEMFLVMDSRSIISIGQSEKPENYLETNRI